jgi:ABC-type multidrug transport system ATPase subunit
VSTLSGGNQQKVVIGKWLLADSRVLILDEPTRGVDAGAKVEIYRLVNELTASGHAVLMISSDLPEVLGMADRLMPAAGLEVSAFGAAAAYRGLLDGWVIDRQDASLAPRIETDLGLRVAVTDTIMSDDVAAERVARAVLDVVAG